MKIFVQRNGFLFVAVFVAIFFFSAIDSARAIDIIFKPQVSIPGSEFIASRVVTVDKDTLVNYVRAIYAFLIALSGILAVAVIVFAGFGWMLSAGNQEKIRHSKSLMVGALMGLFLAMFSYSLLNTLNTDIVKLNNIFDVGTIPRLDQIYFSGDSEASAEVVQNCSDSISTAADPSCTGLSVVATTSGGNTTTVANLKSTSLYLFADAARAWEYMASDYYNVFSKAIPVNHMFRSSQYQSCLYQSWNAGGQKGHTVAKPCSSPHEKGVGVDVNTSSLTQEQYNWLVCQKQTTCDITKESTKYAGGVSHPLNKVATNTYGFLILNYNPKKSDGVIWEQHHFTYVTKQPSIVDICPSTTACR